MDKLNEANAAALAAAGALGMQSFGDPTGPALAPKSVEELPPSKPEDFQTPQLSSEEVQALREIIFHRMRQKKQEFVLPDLEITDAERDRFAECLATRKPFIDKFTMMKGKLTVSFRNKTKAENDLLFDQLDVDFKANRIRSETKYITLLNNYNLLIQMVEFQGVKQPPLLPSGMVLAPTWSLHDAMKAHFIESLPEPHVYLLLGALAQFDAKVRVLSQEALGQNFSTPVVDI